MRFLRVGLIAAACMALPAAASATVTKAPNGHRLSLMLRHGLKGGGGGTRSSGGGVLVNHRGPVLTAEAPYLIYWAPGGVSTPGPFSIPGSSTGLLNQYMADVAAASGSTTNVYSVLTQYSAPYKQTFGSAQTVTDTSAYPGTGCSLAPGMTGCVSDASIQTEISKLIATGKLPSPTAPGSGKTPIFFVITPVDVNVCTTTSQCVNNSFCAYHSYFTSGGHDVLYASVPFSVFANNNTKGCQTDGNQVYETPVGSSGDEAYNVADDLSHELSETITDPLINAWYSKNGLEVGDLCEAYAATANTSKGYSPYAYQPAVGNPFSGTLYDQIINNHQYYNQTEYSNSAGGCMTGVTHF